MIPENIEQFVKDVKAMRDAQNAYFKARKEKAPWEQANRLYLESKRLEKIVDEQTKEKEPSLFTF